MTASPWPIIGHQRAVNLLHHSIQTDRLAHAYLLVGPPAIGKFTLAQTLAQALLCTPPAAPASGGNGPATDQSRPCGECRACRLVQAGHHPDLHIIDIVTHAPDRRERRELSIEQIRALQHDLSLHPYEGQWKIGLIREVERLSEPAANAFLKTLEEPPGQALLVLTSRDTSLLLPTIVSRCQIVAMHPVPVAEITEALISRYRLTTEQARLIAHLCQGQVGWAIRAAQDPDLLAQRAARLKRLTDLTGASRSERLAYAGQLSQQFRRDSEGPETLYQLLDLWAGWWRDILLTQQGCPELRINVDQAERLQRLADHYPPATSRAFIQTIRQTQAYLIQNVNPQLALEVLLLSLPA